jgi:hypothetical protein
MAFIVVVAIANSASDLTGGLITSRVYGLLGNIVQVLAVRLWEWATRIGVGSTIDSDKFAPASIVVTPAHSRGRGQHPLVFCGRGRLNLDYRGVGAPTEDTG